MVEDRARMRHRRQTDMTITGRCADAAPPPAAAARAVTGASRRCRRFLEELSLGAREGWSTLRPSHCVRCVMETVWQVQIIWQVDADMWGDLAELAQDAFSRIVS